MAAALAAGELLVTPHPTMTMTQSEDDLLVSSSSSSMISIKPQESEDRHLPSIIKVDETLDGTETTVDESRSSLYGGNEVLPVVQEAGDAITPTIPSQVSTIIPQLDYASIPSFDKFTDLVNDDHYIKIPSSWHVLVADIEGSTSLIEQGRYRDVNTIGVSCIAAVRNALKKLPKSKTCTASDSFNEDFPFCFGGDGASMVVAPRQHEAACDALLAVQTLAYNNYNMQLRVGSIPVSLLEQQGNVVVEVARYEIASGMCIALFRGGGLALADTWVKAGQGQLFGDDDDNDDDAWLEEPSESSDLGLHEEDYSTGDEASLSDNDSEQQQQQQQSAAKPKRKQDANLDGLSCRWKKIPSKHGCVLSVLVMHNEDVYSNEFLSKRHFDSLTSDEESDAPSSKDRKPSSSEIYAKVLNKFQEILQPENSLQKSNPVNPELATYKSAGEMIDDENRMHTRRKSSFQFWTGRAVEIGLCHVIFKMKQLQTAIIDAPHYTQAMRTHADHCKFDDMVRMVLDCTPEQADAIEKYLKGLHKHGRQVFYGLQRSQHTLMTCLLEDTNDGNHIHFVDGDLGGYAVAAKSLKLQLGNYAMAKRGMKVRLDLTKQHSLKRNKPKSKKKLRKTITQ